MVWIIAEQDMGGDEFLAVLSKAQEINERSIYRLNLHSFKGLVDELNSLQEIVIGGDINALCEQLYLEEAYLILDEVNIAGTADERRAIFSGAEELAKIFLDNCKNLKVIIRSPTYLSIAGFNPVILQSLDEPECKSYLELHPLANNARKEDIDSGAIYSHTSGRPGRIDKTLASLAFNSFESIALGSSDESIDFQATISTSLKTEIEKLRSGNAFEQVIYNLLVALTFFKYGESVQTIKYFGDCRRIKPGMADHLVNSGLAELAETFELSMAPGENDKFVMVKPAVQQYIHKQLGEEQLITFYEEAAAIYFGKEWKIGSCKIHSSFRFTSHRINSVIEQNAALILARIISDALNPDDGKPKQKEIIDRIKVFHDYLQKLMQTDKYLYVLRLCRILLPKLHDYDGHHFIKNIRFQFARALRMLGEYEEAISECKELLTQENPAEIRASLHVNMAYAYENLENIDKAKEMALAAKSIKKIGPTFYHAESILLGLADDESKYKKLDNLATKARRKGSLVSSNTIKMDVIAELNDPREQMEEYRKLADRAQGDSDAYNMMRARVYWFELAVELGVEIDPKSVEILVSAYTYSCSQRQRKMFTQSHAALWIILERSNQTESLLQLFRHSSTLQRLTGKVSTEQEYLKRLEKHIRGVGFEQVIKHCQPSALRYFAARADSYNLLNSQQLNLINNQVNMTIRIV
ncbi:tetratricopeptide repeat protein [Pseudomonas aeruginosa]